MRTTAQPEIADHGRLKVLLLSWRFLPRSSWTRMKPESTPRRAADTAGVGHHARDLQAGRPCITARSAASISGRAVRARGEARRARRRRVCARQGRAVSQADATVHDVTCPFVTLTLALIVSWRAPSPAALGACWASAARVLVPFFTLGLNFPSRLRRPSPEDRHSRRRAQSRRAARKQLINMRFRHGDRGAHGGQPARRRSRRRYSAGRRFEKAFGVGGGDRSGDHVSRMRERANVSSIRADPALSAALITRKRGRLVTYRVRVCRARSPRSSSRQSLVGCSHRRRSDQGAGAQRVVWRAFARAAATSCLMIGRSRDEPAAVVY